MNDPISAAECEALFACLDDVSHAGLAVSGGADSTALMHLAARWREGRESAMPRFTVLTVDHGLRAESAREARWVEAQAKALDLPCAVLRWDPGGKASRIQADARDARYGLMAEYAHAHGLDALVTAHHLDDQAETLLMRLGRGSGIDGLSGIPARGQWAGLAVLRPFLDLPKTRLVTTLEKLGAEWLEDPSNQDTRFERARLRRAMDELPALGIGPEALALSARRLRRAREALEALARAFLEGHARLEEAGYCRIAAAALKEAPEEIGLRALASALQGIGGRMSPPRLAKLEVLYAGFKAGDPAPSTLGGCRVSLEEGDILIQREAGRAETGSMLLRPGTAALWDNRYRVSIGQESAAPVEVRALGQEGYGQVRALLGQLVSLPGHTADTLVSFWREGELIAVPPLGFVTAAARQARCEARFVNRGLFLGRR